MNPVDAIRTAAASLPARTTPAIVEVHDRATGRVRYVSTSDARATMARVKPYAMMMRAHDTIGAEAFIRSQN